jgi:hypothetical protein
MKNTGCTMGHKQRSDSHDDLRAGGRDTLRAVDRLPLDRAHAFDLEGPRRVASPHTCPALESSGAEFRLEAIPETAEGQS